MENKDIVWGEAVATPNGQPEWLSDDVLCRPRWGDSEEGRYDEGGAPAHCVASWGLVKDILLPADHPHYAAATSIDWTKPLELMDGTAVVLANMIGEHWGGTNPDTHGDYWVKREDGEKIEGCTKWCVGPRTDQVRNRAAPTILTDPYGPPIEVAGVRPAWLGDARGLFENTPDQWMDADKPLSEYAWGSDRGSFEACPLSIRLPRDHFAYTAIAKGFEPWGGGDEAPEDWDGGDVLFACGQACKGGDWRWDHSAFPLDIIGYRKRVETPIDKSHPSHDLRSSDASTFDFICKKCGRTDEVPVGWGLLEEPCPAAEPAPADPDTVTLKRMTKSEWKDRIYQHRYNLTDALRELGLIKPDPTPPTPIEAFEADNPGVVTDENRHWFELALGWGRN